MAATVSACTPSSATPNDPLTGARRAREEHGVDRIGFGGGMFRNRTLTEAAIKRLEDDGFTVRYPDQIPVNDAGLSRGQVIEYAFARASSVE
jgi:hydrogenase maturation protein HypF